MIIEHLVAWVNGLRSGDYEQIQGSLHCIVNNTVAHCAVGVLDKVTRPDKIKLYEIDTCGGTAAILRTHGIASRGDDWRMGIGIGWDIVRMNDHENKNFNEIADYIEDNKDKFLGVKHES